ncbi:MAG: metallophosphoesterase family protein [Myxococcota bacterium]
MRIAVFSDIHGNLEALSAVLKAIKELAPDKIVCLGDVVGYGASPNECCELIREHTNFSILGNHDAAVSGRMDYNYYYEAARKALDWCRHSLKEDNLRWLEQNPYIVVEGDITFVHGSPIDPENFDYIFAPEQARGLLPYAQKLSKITFLGHSHLCRVFAFFGKTVHEVPPRHFGLRQGYKYIVADGSVGQPRDYDNRAGFVIYNSELDTVEYFRVEYDIASSAEKILRAGLPPNFARRLFLGV